MDLSLTRQLTALLLTASEPNAFVHMFIVTNLHVMYSAMQMCYFVLFLLSVMFFCFCIVSGRNFFQSVETTTMKAKVAGAAEEVVAAVVSVVMVVDVVEVDSEAVAVETQEEGKVFLCELYALRQHI